MLMQTQSINDRNLLLAVGFFCPDHKTGAQPDYGRIATFCGVSERTAQRWLRDGLPKHARAHFENLLAGDYLPDNWRKLGIKVAHDRVYLQSGHFIMLDTMRYWPFISQAVDWSRVPAPSVISL